jgi:hypothetical protein
MSAALSSEPSSTRPADSSEPSSKRPKMASRLVSWVPVPADCDWTIHNIPFGIFSTLTNTTPRPGTAIGEHVRDQRGQLGARRIACFPAAVRRPPDSPLTGRPLLCTRPP